MSAQSTRNSLQLSLWSLRRSTNMSGVLQAIARHLFDLVRAFSTLAMEIWELERIPPLVFLPPLTLYHGAHPV